jgi:hypothetical protein
MYFLQIQRKRRINPGAPEFPSLPKRFSPEMVPAFAAKSQLALNSITLDKSSILLPLISPHLLQYGLEFGENDSVFVIRRESYLSLKRELVDLDTSKYNGIYVQLYKLTLVVFKASARVMISTSWPLSSVGTEASTESRI